MKRGEIYDVRLDPIEGSEQGGIRPVVIVSRDVITIEVLLCWPFLVRLIDRESAFIQLRF